MKCYLIEFERAKRFLLALFTYVELFDFFFLFFFNKKQIKHFIFEQSQTNIFYFRSDNYVLLHNSTVCIIIQCCQPNSTSTRLPLYSR